MSGKSREKLEMLILEFDEILHRELSAGVPRDEARRTAFLEVSHRHAGERVYIAGVPKAQRVRQIAKAKRKAARDIAAETGLSERRVRQLLK